MKNKWIALVLSIIFPGVGHFYLGYIKQGGLYLILSIILTVLINQISDLFSLGYVLLLILVSIDSWKKAKSI
ncbi:NINE protein [Oceanobacillus kimchii]|uniref:NINE protein n=1 Tax=Oceanobacillus kimchii TaxID=746691 RepID=UPI000984B75E|nr:NINE protein [Oceanobacillus kimchii]